MRDDILGGLKNALERGSSLEDAIRSFINAGYPEAEVREAAQAIQPTGTTMTALPQVPKKTLIPLTIAHRPPIQPINPIKTLSVEPIQQKPLIQQPFKPKRKTPWLLIALISVLVILLAVLGVSILFREQIVLFLRTR